MVNPGSKIHGSHFGRHLFLGNKVGQHFTVFYGGLTSLFANTCPRYFVCSKSNGVQETGKLSNSISSKHLQSRAFEYRQRVFFDRFEGAFGFFFQVWSWPGSVWQSPTIGFVLPVKRKAPKKIRICMPSIPIGMRLMKSSMIWTHRLSPALTIKCAVLLSKPSSCIKPNRRQCRTMQFRVHFYWHKGYVWLLRHLGFVHIDFGTVKPPWLLMTAKLNRVVHF
jgi:hypothetical protein